MSLKKSFFYTLTSFFLFTMFLMFFNYFYLCKSFMNSLYFKFYTIDLSMNLDKESLVFTSMATMVTCMVILYAEFYMEHYNNKKFFFLTFSFFSSMIFLVFSGSYIILMLGWDMLGLSSLFLIMFYPGKIPLFNSFMTFFYNRMGDCIMILILCLLLNTSSVIFSFVVSTDIYMILVMLVFCSFAKSAQFPLSSWLPAAMSAPTPISAMVHSSTLVTAGIFLIYKFFFFLLELGFCHLILFISCLTFLIGGLLGLLELDLKKIVAFSTMSQISLIILFCSINFLVICLSHMVFHAFFKTLLFCSCGFLFCWVYSDQLTKSVGIMKDFFFFFFFLLISIFCMSGLPFSSSFFSKDLLLEQCVASSASFLAISLIVGSMFTILYSSKIIGMIKTSFYYNLFSYNQKNNFFSFSVLFSVLTLLSPYIYQNSLLWCNFPSVSFQDMMFIILMIFSCLTFNLSFKMSSMWLSMELFFSKFSIFGGNSKFIMLDKFSFHFNDQLIFKPSSFFISSKFYSKSSMNSFMFFLALIFLFFFIY